MSKNKSIELSLCGNYVSNWGLNKALVELAQNTLDEGGDITYNVAAGKITFSTDEPLPLTSLLMGATSKAGDISTRGEKGEGYKLAALVLLREGKGLSVHRRQKSAWAFTMQDSKTFDAPVLHVQTSPPEVWKGRETVFTVSGITSEEWLEFTPRVLQLGESYETADTSAEGSIITTPSYRGKVFVGGLYVFTDEFLAYGYDLATKHVRLDRDRDTIQGADLTWEVAKLHAGRTDENAVEDLSQMLQANRKDVRYLHCNHTTRATEAIQETAEKLVKANGKNYPVESESDLADYQDSTGKPAAYIPSIQIIPLEAVTDAYARVYADNPIPKKIVYVKVAETDLLELETELDLVETILDELIPHLEDGMHAPDLAGLFNILKRMKAV